MISLFNVHILIHDCDDHFLSYCFWVYSCMSALYVMLYYSDHFNISLQTDFQEIQ